MRRSVLIKTPYPTPEETARVYGISKRRAKELRKIVEESLARRVSFYENGAGSSSSKNGAAHAKAPNGRFAAEGAGTKNRRVRPQRVSARKPKRGKAANSH